MHWAAPTRLVSYWWVRTRVEAGLHPCPPAGSSLGPTTGNMPTGTHSIHKEPVAHREGGFLFLSRVS